MHHGKEVLWILIWTLCLLGYPEAVIGQKNIRLSAVPDLSLTADYAKVHLFNGRGFTPHPSGIVGSANHQNLDLTANCTVVFDGILYENIPLMYDLVTDEVITKHPDRKEDFILESHLISQFTIAGDTFVRIREGYSGLSPGFYQQIFLGDFFVCYAKRTKLVRNYSSGTTLERRYISGVTFYLMDTRDQAKIQIIRSQNNLLSIDKSERKATRRLLKDAALNFRTAPEKTLSLVLGYLDNQHDSRSDF